MFKGKRQLATVKTPVKDLLPVDIKLSESKFEYKLNNGVGKWKSKSKNAEEDEKHIASLQNEVDRLRERLSALEKHNIKEIETRYMVEFKNKLLLEMLAVARLDADKNNRSFKTETLKTEALKLELANLRQSAITFE